MPHLQRSHVISLFVLVFLLASLIAIRGYLFYVQDLQSRATETSSSPPPPPVKYVEGEVIVKLKPGVSSIGSEGTDVQAVGKPTSFEQLVGQDVPSGLKNAAQKITFKTVEPVFPEVKTKLSNKGLPPAERDSLATISQVYKLTFDPTTKVETAVDELKKQEDVEYAEPNYIYEMSVIPNDPEFSKLWGLHNTSQTGGMTDVDMDAPEGWDIEKGSSSVVVGVIDSGVDYNHPDLLANIWVNDDEIPNNGLDDDGNGYIDDRNGWDFYQNDTTPMDENGHGTHVSGTIGAVGNNSVGVVGVAWNVKIMPLRFLGPSGSGSSDAAARAIIYAANNGARLTNNSWGGGGFSNTLVNAISYARSKNNLFVAAAGNSGRNTDTSPQYPAAYSLDNIISVAALKSNNLYAGFSNFGVTTVDIAAPGVDIYSTLPNNRYIHQNGTSMASPHVAGAAAVLWSKNPDYTYSKIKNLLVFSGDPTGQVGMTLSDSSVNLQKALSEKEVYITPKSIAFTSLPDVTTKTKITIFNNSTGQKNYTVTSKDTWVTGGAQGVVEPGAAQSIEILIDTKNKDSQQYTSEVVVQVADTSYTIPISVQVRPVYLDWWGATIGGVNTDQAMDMTSDAEGNIYVLGYFYGTTKIGEETFTSESTSESDQFIVSYTKEGQLRWAKHIKNKSHAYTGSLIYDAKTNQLVIALKYSGPLVIGLETRESSTEELFVARFDTSGGLQKLLTLDPPGWVFSTQALAVDSEQNYVIAFNTENTANHLAKYDQNGTELWKKQTDEVYGVAIDGSNRIYTTGTKELTRYTAQGEELGTGSVIPRFGKGHAIAVDTAGDIVIGGYFNVYTADWLTPNTDWDPLVAKYSTEGQLKWTKQIVGEYQNEYVDELTIDEDNFIYVAGRFSGNMYIDGRLVEQDVDSLNKKPHVYLAVFDTNSQFMYFTSFISQGTDRVAGIAARAGRVNLAGDYGESSLRYLTRYLNPQGYDIYLAQLKVYRTVPVVTPPANPASAAFIQHGSYLRISDAANKLVIEPTATFEMWFKPQINPRNYTSQSLFFRNTTTSNYRDIFDIIHSADTTKNKTQVTLRFGIDYRLNDWLLLDQWYHLAFVREGKAIKVFINGDERQNMLIETADRIPASGEGKVSIGANAFDWGTNLQYMGAVDELRVSNTVRDVAGLWRQGVYQQGLQKDDATLGLWKFDDDFQDSSNNNFLTEKSGEVSFVPGVVAQRQIQNTQVQFSLTTNPKSVKNYTLRGVADKSAAPNQAFTLYMDNPTTDDGDKFYSATTATVKQTKEYKLQILGKPFVNGWHLQDIVCSDPSVLVSKNITSASAVLKTTTQTEATCEISTYRNNVIAARAFNDQNKDGRKNATESYMAGWSMKLYDTNKNLLQQAQTTATASAVFRDLQAGTYTVCEDLQSGWVGTRPAQVDPRFNAPCYDVQFSSIAETKSAIFGNFTSQPVSVQRSAVTDLTQEE